MTHAILVAIIITLIYGVSPVGTMCDEIIKLLVEEIWEKFPSVAILLIKKRYVDDLGSSNKNKSITSEVIQQTDECLATIAMKIKGWVISGEAPAEAMSEDGKSVGFAGLTWLPQADIFKLNIQSLHFSKKKRGKFPSDLVKFDQTKGISIGEFTPKNITRTHCTSVTARIYDITGP